MNWYAAAMKKYAVFSGRARRKEYWMFYLFNIIFLIVAFLLDKLLGTASKDTGIGVIYFLYALVIMIPSLAATVRRLHDIGKSGWWFFITLIPFIGSIWLIVLLATSGQAGPNQYGPDPKENPVIEPA